MARVAVGQLYNPARTRWPEAIQYNFRGGEHELLLLLADPSPAEVEAVRQEPGEVALIVDGPVVLLWYRLGIKLDGDAPYAWHRVPAHERTLPPATAGEQRAVLHLVLVDANTGVVRGLRLASLSPAFTVALHDAIRAQAAAPWDAAAYDRALAAFYARNRTAAEILRHARARCALGA